MPDTPAFDDTLAWQLRRGRPLDVGTPIIDIHSHVGPYFVHNPKMFGAEHLVEVMDRTGVDKSCIFSHRAVQSDWLSGNDETAGAVARFPNRFIGFAVADANFPDQIPSELERCFETLDLKHIKIHCALHQVPWDDRRYEPVLDFANERGCCVLVHTWPQCFDTYRKYAEKYPRITFIAAHLNYWDATDGHPWPKVVRECPNVYSDLCRSWTEYNYIAQAIAAFGAENLVWGSDFPFIGQPNQLAKVAYAKIPLVDKTKLLSLNALKIISGLI